jgi:hypothetical protein
MAVQLITGAAAQDDNIVLAFASNLIGLTNLPVGAAKYAFSIRSEIGSELLADIRISPNQYGDAYLDIENILSSQVSPKIKYLIDQKTTSTQAWLTSEAEVTSVYFEYGSEATDGTVTWDEIVNRIYITRGRLDNWQMVLRNNEADPSINTFEEAMRWRVEDSGVNYLYSTPLVSGVGPGDECTSILSVGSGLSDIEEYKLSNEITDGVPELLPNTKIFVQDITRWTKWGVTKLPLRTISIQNNLRFVPPPFGNPVDANVKGCEGYYITEYDNAGTLLNRTWFPNIESRGGGPNTAVFEGSDPYSKFQFLTAVINDTSNTPNWLPDENTSHFYVTFHIGEKNGCTEEATWTPNVMDVPAWDAYRFNVKEQCFGYSPFSVRWLNSKGFYDWFQFNKKHEYNLNAKRNTFLAGNIDYNRSQSQTLGFNDAGDKVYSQSISKTYELTTDWLTDKESKFLESLFRSPEIAFIDQDLNSIPFLQFGTIIDKTYVERTYKKNRLFQYTLKIKEAYNLPSQLG